MIVLTCYKYGPDHWRVVAYHGDDGRTFIDLMFPKRRQAEAYARGLRDGIGIIPVQVESREVVGKRNAVVL